MGRSEELEEFLRRVEDYDSQRKENDHVVKGSDNAGSNGITSRYSEESLKLARNLLAKSDVEIVDKESGNVTLKAPELAYRSAYNYEKTFSPSRKVTTSSKTYIVSEDDYLLLQRLKAKEKPPAPLPPREKSKENDRLKASLRHIIDQNPSEATIATHLPIDPYPEIQVRESEEAASSTASDTTKNEEVSSVPIEPIVPNTKNRQENQLENLKLNGETEKHNSSSRFSTPKSSHKIELKSSPKKLNLNAELGLPEKISTPQNSKPSSSTNEPPSKSSRSHIGFPDFIQQDKMKSTLEKRKPNPSNETPALPFDKFIDSAVQRSSLPPDKPAKPSQLTAPSCNRSSTSETQSYISSVLKYSAPRQPTSEHFRANFTLPSKQGKESFIDSVLKTSPILPPPPAMKTKTITKPVPVTKPVALRKSSTAPNDDDAEQEKNAQTSKLSLLRSRTADERSNPPKVPPKKSELALPKTLLKNQSSLKTDFGAKLKKTMPPEVPKKKPSLPEALTRLGNLSKPPPSPERHDEIPEALTKVGRLSKAPRSPERHDEIPEALRKVGHLSKAPRAPERHDEIPEALTKVGRLSKAPPSPERHYEVPEALTKVRQLSKTAPSPERTEVVPEALSRLGKLNKTSKESSITMRNISMEEALHGPSRAKDVRNQLGAVLMAHNLGPSSTSISNNNGDTRTTSTSLSDTPTLCHASRRRSRGPKRRMPSNIKN